MKNSYKKHLPFTCPFSTI